MYSHNFYKPNWHYYRQDQRGSPQQGGMPSGGLSHPSSSQDLSSHGQGSIQGNSYTSYPTSSYIGNLSDKQYILQMLISLGNQLDHLSMLIAQNNQLLQSLQSQDDTKCVQGGSGTVIVRM